MNIISHILLILIILIPLTLIVKLINGVIKENRSNGIKIKRLKDWSKFNSDMKSMSDEIVDRKVREDFLRECLEILNKALSDKDYILNTDISITDYVMKNDMMVKYSKHIPSLIKMIRDDNLNKILYGKNI